MAVTFKQWLDARPQIKKDYSKLTAAQQKAYKTAWQEDKAAGAKAYMDSVGGSTPKPTRDDSLFKKWLGERPLISNKYDQLNEADKDTYKQLWVKGDLDKAKTFLNSSLNISTPHTATTDVEGVSIPNWVDYPRGDYLGQADAEGNIKYPVPTLTAAEYKPQEGITSTKTEKVEGITAPDYQKTGSISGGSLSRVSPVEAPEYEGAAQIGQSTADAADYNMVDPMSFAGEYGEFYRDEVLKNADLADQIALQQLNTELAGLTEYASASAALKRSETSIDNAFNQAQRTKQVDEALPGMREDLVAQRDRASAYAEGRLPDEMEDRMMELNVRSRSADMSGAAGFGAGSVAAQKASTLMSAEQRLGVAQMGEDLLTKNMVARSELLLAPTQYSDSGAQINVMPSQSASVLSAASLGQLNELANVSATNALGTRVGQEQFNATLLNDISKFNASIQQDTEKFNASLAEQQAQYKSNRDTQIAEFNAQLAANENLSEAEIQQRTQEFNARLSQGDEQFNAGLKSQTDTFNAQLAVNQNQFNATVEQRTKEYNATLATQQAMFQTQLQQQVNEYNTTMAYNTSMTNLGIKNTIALGAFDYEVTYNGLVAGAINKSRDTKLQLDLAKLELEYYREAQAKQFELEEKKLQIMADQIEAQEVAGNLG